MGMDTDPVLLTAPTYREMASFTTLIDGARTMAIVCGVGPASAACALTRFLERNPVRAVLLCGIGGTYPRSDLGIGDVALAGSEVLADLGRCTESGIIPLDIAGETPRIRFFLEDTARRILGSVPPGITIAPMATVSCTSGTMERAELIARHTGAWVENMEGAAAALVCTEYGVPLIELRGISNVAGNPDRSGWRIDKALDSTAEAAECILTSMLKT